MKPPDEIRRRQIERTIDYVKAANKKKKPETSF